MLVNTLRFSFSFLICKRRLNERTGGSEHEVCHAGNLWEVVTREGDAALILTSSVPHTSCHSPIPGRNWSSLIIWRGNWLRKVAASSSRSKFQQFLGFPLSSQRSGCGIQSIIVLQPQRETLANDGEGVEKSEPSHTAGGDVRQYSHLGTSPAVF